MADDSHPTPFGDSATPKIVVNETWRSIGDVVRELVERACKEREARK